MANNRMYLRCDGCGETIGIAKHFGAEWGVYARFFAALESWLDEHRWCASDGAVAAEGTQFQVVYERDPSGKAELARP